MTAAMALPPPKPTLTPEQKAALDALPPKRRAFVLALVGEAQWNGRAAARIAGYKTPQVEGARLLAIDSVRAVVEALRSSETSSKIATVTELREMWTRWARGEDGSFENRDRLKASELLGKSHGAFVERREVEHHGQAPTLAIQIVATPDEVDRFLDSGSKGGKGDE